MPTVLLVKPMPKQRPRQPREKLTTREKPSPPSKPKKVSRPIKSSLSVSRFSSADSRKNQHIENFTPYFNKKPDIVEEMSHNFRKVKNSNDNSSESPDYSGLNTKRSNSSDNNNHLDSIKIYHKRLKSPTDFLRRLQNEQENSPVPHNPKGQQESLGKVVGQHKNELRKNFGNVFGKDKNSYIKNFIKEAQLKFHKNNRDYTKSLGSKKLGGGQKKRSVELDH
jgi:hypothetical protein